MNMRRVVFVVALALILGGGVLYKSPISFAAENPASAQSGFLNPLRTQAASVYTAVQDFWNGLFGTPDLAKSPTGSAPEEPVVNLEALPPKVAPSTPALGGSTAKLPPSPVVGTTTASTVPPRVVERVIERIPIQSVTRVLSGVTATDLETQIASLRSELLNEIAKGKAIATQDNNALYLAMAPMNRINNLSSVTISNPTITGASISSGTLSGTFSGSVSGSTGSFDTLGIGTTTPSDTFAINGVTYLAQVSAPAVTTNRLYNTNGDLYWNGSIVGGGTVGQWTLSGSDVYRASGNVGIGTTSPYAKLSVAGEVVGSYFTATSSTASIFPYASTTAFTVSGNSYLGTVSSGVWNGAAIGLAYGGTGATTATGVQDALGLMYATSTDVTTRTNIAAWGDSLTYNQTGYPQQLGVLSGIPIYNGGVGGESSTGIKTRMLAATDKYSYPTIIWAGRNNFSSPTTVKADIATMVAALTTDRYIILSVLNQNVSAEWSGGADYITITTLNNDLSALYGSHYIDIRAYLIANGLTDAGITATAQDLIDIGHDVIPTSLRTDNIHLTSAGYGSVAKRINQSISLLQKSTATVLTPESLFTVFRNGYKQNGETVLFASTTDYSTLTGVRAGSYLNGTGIHNTVNGYFALNTATSSSYNTAIGSNVLYANTSGYSNVGVGYQALWSNTTGYFNTAIGQQALRANTIGTYNVAIGYGAAQANTTGFRIVAIGDGALSAQTVYGNNTGIGFLALGAEYAGQNNTAIGSLAGYGTVIGHRSVGDNYALFLGDAASRDASATGNLTNITAIGKNARVGSSNMMVLGGTGADAVKVGLGTTTPYSILSISNSATTAVNTPLFTIASTTAGTATSTLMTILASGNVGIGTAAPAKSLQVIGDIRVGTSGINGCVENFAGTALTGVCSSDVSLKTNIQPMGSVLGDLTQLTPSTFYWNDVAGSELHNSTTTLNYGLIAQDVVRVLPNMVATTSNGYLGVNYSMLPILTLQGLKELDLNLEGLASTTAVTVDAVGGKTFVGRFFDRITGWLADTANGIGEVVARVFRGKEFHAEEKICVGQPGNETCVTKDQLDALLSRSASNLEARLPSTEVSATSTPITISINGNNPATLNIGDTYGDLGALITAPESAKNFGIKASLDGGPELDISQISLDTSVAGSYTIVYSVVDQNNATTTAERVVNVVAPAPVVSEVANQEETATTTPAE